MTDIVERADAKLAEEGMALTIVKQDKKIKRLKKTIKAQGLPIVPSSIHDDAGGDKTNRSRNHNMVFDYIMLVS